MKTFTGPVGPLQGFGAYPNQAKKEQSSLP